MISVAAHLSDQEEEEREESYLQSNLFVYIVPYQARMCNEQNRSSVTWCLLWQWQAGWDRAGPAALRSGDLLCGGG